MVASIALGRGGRGLFRRVASEKEAVTVSSRWRLFKRGEATGGNRGMKYTWYVTFEVPTDGTLSRRRHPRLTQTFETEAAAKDFARTKFNEGLIVTAGTIVPHLPKVAIPSVEIPAWLGCARRS
jgi:hypothetical protein